MKEQFETNQLSTLARSVRFDPWELIFWAKRRNILLALCFQVCNKGGDSNCNKRKETGDTGRMENCNYVQWTVVNVLGQATRKNNSQAVRKLRGRSSSWLSWKQCTRLVLCFFFNRSKICKGSMKYSETTLFKTNKLSTKNLKRNQKNLMVQKSRVREAAGTREGSKHYQV